MATTNFINGTVIQDDWMNDVDAVAYETVPFHTASLAILAGSAGAANVGYTPAGAGASATITVQGKLRESVSVLDFGASPSASATANTAALAAAFVASTNVYAPAGTYNLAATTTIPPWGHLHGDGVHNTNFVITTDNVAFVTQYWSQISHIKVTKSGLHTKNLIEVGSALLDAGRTTLSNIWVEGAGNDGIQLIYGNLGQLENIVSISNGRDGVNFKAGNIDLNAWTTTGYIDVRGNARDGFHVEANAVFGTALASSTNNFYAVTAQENGRYGINIGTRSNLLMGGYGELNGTADIYLGSSARGNRICVMQGIVTDASPNPSFNMVENGNSQAGYQRIFQGRVGFSGLPTAGFRITQDDDTSGTLTFRKTAQNTYAIETNSSGAPHRVVFASADGPTVWEFGGAIQLSTGVMILTGTGSPEGVVAAIIGSLYTRTDGGTLTTLYVKTADGGGTTGWTAK